MNKRTVRLLTDCLLAVLLVVLWRAFRLEQSTFELGLPVAIGLLPLIWLALRYGAPTAIVFSALAGCINLIFANEYPDWSTRILVEITPLLATGLAGLFAKYTQKTLNNRRFSSTYLNIATASLLVTFVYFGLRYVLLPMLIPNVTGMALNSLYLWGSWLLTAALIAIVLIILAKINQELIIPKRSKYLSRKETSKLLND